LTKCAFHGFSFKWRTFERLFISHGDLDKRTAIDLHWGDVSDALDVDVILGKFLQQFRIHLETLDEASVEYDPAWPRQIHQPGGQIQRPARII